MKSPAILRSGLFLLAGLAAITAFAADETPRPYIGHVNEVKDRLGYVMFADGDSAATVMDRLKQPHQKLSNCVWVYREFRAFNKSSSQAVTHACDNLVVSFGPGKKLGDQKITAIVLANAKGLETIENNLKQNPRYLEDLLTGY
jgi:hypothetical protein